LNLTPLIVRQSNGHAKIVMYLLMLRDARELTILVSSS
jgi:hypothetical protein